MHELNGVLQVFNRQLHKNMEDMLFNTEHLLTINRTANVPVLMSFH